MYCMRDIYEAVWTKGSMLYTAKRIGRTDTHVSDRAIICELNLQIADSHKKIVINVDDLVKIWSLSIVYRCRPKRCNTSQTDMVRDTQFMIELKICVSETGS